MADIMVTSGNNFEGYDIVEYLGFVNGQIALSSNFFKDLSSNLADFTAQESTAFTNKLENASENAIENLLKVAEKRGANALVGVELNYTNFSGGSVGTVASGTAVIIKKKAPIHKIVTSKIYVSNYYNMLMPRPVEVNLAGEDNVELTPQNQRIRKLQHELIEQHNLVSQSIGEGEQRHLRVVGGKDYHKGENVG